MLFFRPASATQKDPRREERNAARYETSVISCPLGRIADLSRTGMRVQCTGKKPPSKGLSFDLELFSPSDSLMVPMQVVSVTRLGWGRYELGIKFVNINEETAQAIENLAKFGKVKSVSPEANDRRRRALAAIRRPDHYKVLGITPSASADEIQQAFRALARKYHPDINATHEAEQIFCEINQSYQVLGDPQQRAEYDGLMGYSDAA